MASISTSIELYDRVSRPINNMISAINNMIGAYESVESAMNSGFDTSIVREARQAIDLAARQAGEMAEEVRVASENQERFNNSAHAGASAMDGLGKKVMGVVAAYASVQTIGKVMDISDELTQTTARLDMMNDGVQTTDELLNMVYQSAQNARGSFTDMAAVVAKFGNNAGEAFGSSAEVVSFANLVQKQMTIAGASTAESANAMLQLSQALGSGTLRGDELNSIFEQAPNLIQSIADYLEVPIGKIREMAKEGQLSADIVKTAIFASADEINAQFEQMPMTWNQVWTTMQNAALLQFQPVLQKVNELANNQDFQRFATNAVGGLATISIYLLDIMEMAGAVAMFFSDNWSTIGPIVYGIVTALALYAAYLGITKIAEMASVAAKVAMCIASYAHAAATGTEVGATVAATAAQHGLNAALWACPITWILAVIILVIVAIYAIIGAINECAGTSISATGVIIGTLTTAVAVVWNLFLGILDLVLGVINYMVNKWIAFANFFANLFNDPIGAIIHLFGDMADNILGILESIAKAIDKVFGSNLAGAVSGWRNGLDSMVENVANTYGNGSYEKVANELNLSSESLGLKRWSYTDAFDMGYSWGEGIENSVSGIFSGDAFGTSNLFDGGSYEAGQVPTNIADTASNTGKAADSLDITSEDLKYLRDIAETEVVNRFTTAEIKIDMTNNNNVSSNMDLDGMVDYLANGVNEAMEKAAEGVHE